MWGKLLAITVFSMATSVLNLVSLGATGTFMFGRMQALQGVSAQLQLGAPPLACVGWLLAALVPAALMFSALALAVAAMARSTKEGQYYLMPLLLFSVPLMVLPMMPTTELTLGSALVPLSGLMLLLRALIEGEYVQAARFAAPVLAVTGLCVWMSVRWAVAQFNKEEVLFRESERFSLGLWLRQLVRDREATPTLAAAVLGGLVLLAIRFFSMLALPPPSDWSGFVAATLTTLAGCIALPAVLMTLLLAVDWRATLLLRRPGWAAIPAAALLAVLLHPLVRLLGAAVQRVYPLDDATQQKLAGLEGLLEGAPGLWAIVLLLALTPAICEEVAFRGFLLSGLRRLRSQWTAVLLSALFFGVAHGLLQQSIMATLTGVVLGWIAVKTGSLWPCIVYHFTHNAVAVLSTQLNEELAARYPRLLWLVEPAADGIAFHWPVTVISTAGAALLLVWFSRRRPPQPAPANKPVGSAEERAADHPAKNTPAGAGM